MCSEIPDEADDASSMKEKAGYCVSSSLERSRKTFETITMVIVRMRNLRSTPWKKY